MHALCVPKPPAGESPAVGFSFWFKPKGDPIQYYISIFVVLAPAIACILLLLLIEGPAFVVDIKPPKNRIETLKELFAHLAFYGAAWGAFLGFEHNYFFIVLWFSSLVTTSFWLSGYVQEMEDQERSEFLEELRSSVRLVMAEVIPKDPK